MGELRGLLLTCWRVVLFAAATAGTRVLQYSHTLTPSPTAFADLAYFPALDRVYLAPFTSANGGTWVFINSAGVVEGYPNGLDSTPVFPKDKSALTRGYIGAIVHPALDRLYFIPHAQASEDYWHYIDNTGTMVSYARQVTGIALNDAYYGGVLHEDLGRIYFVPHAQVRPTYTLWHYIDVLGVARSYNAVVCEESGYRGGVYHRALARAYFVPYAQSNQATWHYIDSTGDPVAYAHGCPNPPVQYAYHGGVYLPSLDRLYFAPHAQSQRTTWHYLDATGVCVSYPRGAPAEIYGYAGGVLHAELQRIYWVPARQATAPSKMWHFINSTGHSDTYTHSLGRAYTTQQHYQGGTFHAGLGRVYFGPYFASSDFNREWDYVLPCAEDEYINSTCVPCAFTSCNGGTLERCTITSDSSSCTCPEETFHSLPGTCSACSVTSCLGGNYTECSLDSPTDVSACVCPAGTYHAYDDACVACMVTSCSGGSFTKCPVDSIADVSACTCPADTYKFSPTACLPCEHTRASCLSEGTFCAGTSTFDSSTCAVCPANNFFNATSSTCTPCAVTSCTVGYLAACSGDSSEDVSTCECPLDDTTYIDFDGQCHWIPKSIVFEDGPRDAVVGDVLEPAPRVRVLNALGAGIGDAVTVHLRSTGWAGLRGPIEGNITNVTAGALSVAVFNGLYMLAEDRVSLRASLTVEHGPNNGTVLSVQGTYFVVRTRTCAPGTYQLVSSNAAVCSPCPKGSITKEVGQRACATCATTTYAVGGTQCLPCHAGATCVQGIEKGNAGTWWDGSSYVPCSSEACPGGERTPEGATLCAPGHAGFLCGECTREPGAVYARNGGGTCQSCSPLGPIIALFLLYVLLVVAVLAFTFYSAMKAAKKDKALPHDGLLKVLICNLQITSSITAFGGLQTSLGEWLSFSEASSPSLSLFALQCLAAFDFHTEFLITIIFQAVVIMFMVITALILIALKRDAASDTMFATLLVWLHVFYPSVSLTTLRMLPCRGDVGRLVADVTIACDTPTHTAFVVVAVITTVLWVLGIPSWLYALLRRNKDRLSEARPKTRYSFLIAGYSKDNSDYEIFIVLRKIAFFTTATVISSPAGQLGTAVLVLTAALALHHIRRPFASHKVSALETVSLNVNIATVSAAYMLSANPSPGTASAISVITLLGNVVYVGGCALCLLVVRLPAHVQARVPALFLLTDHLPDTEGEADRYGDDAIVDASSSHGTELKTSDNGKL